MNCRETSKKLKEFFEDLLSENQRSEVRAHLEVCGPCTKYSLQFGSFARDLLRMTDREIPFDLTAEILWELGKEPDKRKADSESSGPVWKRAAAACLVFAVFGVLVFYLSRQNPVAPPSPQRQTVPAPAFSSGALPADQAGLPGTDLPQRKSSGRKAGPGITVSLQPVHWHLQFTDFSGRETFLKQARALSKPGYESADFLVLSLDRKGLADLLKAVSSSGARIQGGPVSGVKWPDFNGPVRVSMLLEEPGVKLLPHLHFKFLLSNRLGLRDRLRKKGFKMKYETEELWIFELLPAQWKDLQQEAMDTSGLQTDYSKMGVPEGESALPVSIYIED